MSQCAGGVIMDRWWFVSFLLVTWSCHITPAPTAEDGKAPKCCPCPESGEVTDLRAAEVTDLRTADTAPTPLVARAADGCTCALRDADATSAASVALPREMRAPWTFLRPEQIKPDPKPLLSPEVGLASSVLETIRDATEEEYREALARDAARNEAKSNDGEVLSSDSSSRASDSLVAIVVDPTENKKDIDTSVAATQIKNAKFIDSEKNKIAASLLKQKTRGLLTKPDLNGRLRFSDSDVGASEFSNSFAKAPLESNDRFLKFSTKNQPRDIILPTVNKLSKNIPDFGLKTKLRDVQERMNDILNKERIFRVPMLKLLPEGRAVDEHRRDRGEDNCLSPSNINILNRNVEEHLTKSVGDLNMKAKQFHSNLFKFKDVEMIQDDRNSVSSSRQNIFRLPIIKDLIDSVKSFTPSLGDMFRKPSKNEEQVESAEDDNNLDSSSIELGSTELKPLGTKVMDAIPNPSLFHEVLAAPDTINTNIGNENRNINLINQKEPNNQNERISDGQLIAANTNTENIEESKRSSQFPIPLSKSLTINNSNLSKEPRRLLNKLNNVIETIKNSGPISKINDDTKETSAKFRSSKENRENSQEAIYKAPNTSFTDLQKMADKLLRYGEGNNSAKTVTDETDDCEMNGVHSHEMTASNSKLQNSNVDNFNDKLTARESNVDDAHDMSHVASNSLSRFSIFPEPLNDFSRSDDVLEIKPKLEELKLKLKNVLNIPFKEFNARTSERQSNGDSSNIEAEASWPQPRYYYTPNYSYQLPWQYYRSGNPSNWSPWSAQQPVAQYPVNEKSDFLKESLADKISTSILDRAQPTPSLLTADKLILPKIDEMEQTLRSHLEDLKQRSNLDTLTALKDSIETKLNDVFSSMQEKVTSSLDEVKTGSVKLIGAAINSQPNKLLHVITKSKSDASEKLNALHSSILDRISDLNDKLKSSSTSFSSLARSNKINGKYYLRKPEQSVTTARKIIPKNKGNIAKTLSIDKSSLKNIHLPQSRKIDKTTKFVNSKFYQKAAQPANVVANKFKPRVQEITKELKNKLQVAPITLPKIQKPSFRKSVEPLISATNPKPRIAQTRFSQSSELDKFKKLLKSKIDSLPLPSEMISDISKKSSNLLRATKGSLPKLDLSKLEIPKKSINLKDDTLFRNFEVLKSKFSPIIGRQATKTDFMENLKQSLKPSKPIDKFLYDSKAKFKPVSDMFAKSSSMSEKSIHFDENALKENVPYKCKMVCSRDSKFNL